MASSWSTYKLEDVADIGSSKRIKMADYVSEGVPFYRSKEIIEKNKGNEISTELFITEEQFNAIEEKFGAPKELDILLTSVGTLGVPYQVQKDEQFYVKDGNLTWLRNFKDFVNPRYICFWLTSTIAKRKIDEVTIGSTQQALTIVALKSLTIELPPLKVQNIIMQHLESLTGKIAISRQTNQTLEKMAQVLFKSWFVDFDPVFDNALAADNDIPDALQHKAEQRKQAQQLPDFKPLPDDIRALFPSEFEQTNEPSIGINGWIPKGWKVAVSGEEIDVRDGTHDSPKKSDVGYPLITSRHITDGTLKIEDAYLISKDDYEKVNARSRVETGDVLLTMIGTVSVPYLVLQERVDFAIKNIGLIRTSQNLQLKHYFFQLLKNQTMQNHLDSLLAGTTQKYISLKAMRNIKFLLPEISILTAFNQNLDLYSNKLTQNTQNIKSLEKLRNTLLPKLISGEITINKDVA